MAILLRLTCCAAVFTAICFADAACHASTAAFVGRVVAVEDATEKHKDVLKNFTVEIHYFDYISWNKFGRDSKVGETITRQVKTRGTACMINGRLVNAATFAAAIDAGQWGYFYEDTWLDLQLTPDFLWGEVVSHDPASRQIELRVHRTHKDVHLAANPPIISKVNYPKDTTITIENDPASAEDAIKPGAWLQAHNPRKQMVEVWTVDAAFKPGELLPQAEGKRGFANDLTQAAVLGGYETKTPEGVIDQSVQLLDVKKPDGAPLAETIDARKTTFILDGKPAPVNIGHKAGRRAVLCYYRSEQRPHKIVVRSHDDSTRGVIGRASDGKRITVQHDGEATELPLEPNAIYWLNGRPSTAHEAIKPGREVVVHPARGYTLRAFHAE